MGRILQKAIAGAGGAVAQIGTEGMKAKILNQRQELLNKYQTGERVAGEKARAAESKLDRASREKISENGRFGSNSMKVVGGQLVDSSGKVVPIPVSESERNKLAISLAESEFAGNSRNDYLEDKPALDGLVGKYQKVVNGMYQTGSAAGTGTGTGGNVQGGQVDLSKMTIEQLIEQRKKMTGG